MLGMRRPPPPSSLDDLELERSASASKVRKDDALSIYEVTLQKLRLGSRRVFCEAEGTKIGSPNCESKALPSCVPRPDDSPKSIDEDPQN